MSAAIKDLDLVNRLPEDARFQVLRRWHKTYVALDCVKVVLGLAAFGMWVWGSCSPPRLPALKASRNAWKVVEYIDS